MKNEYTFDGEVYLVTKLPELMGEFELDEAGLESQLQLIHEVLHLKTRPWLIVRRLFGIRPVVSFEDEPVWTRKEACEKIGIKAAELKAYLEGARTLFERGRPEESEAPEASAVSALDEDELSPEAAMHKHGFDKAMFEVDGDERAPSVVSQERKWFGERVVEFDALLSNTMTQGVAREVLNLELQLRRLELPLAQMGPTDPKRERVMKTSKELRTQYEALLSRLDELSPWRANSQGKQTGRATVFSLIEAARAYRAAGDRELVDGIFSAAEIEVMMRTNVQMPGCQYRFGLVTQLREVKEGLLDPQFHPQMRHATVAKLDLIFQDLERDAREALGEPLVDLEDNSQAGEYPEAPLQKPLPDPDKLP